MARKFPNLSIEIVAVLCSVCRHVLFYARVVFMDPQLIVFGGTHGNELTGSFLVNHFLQGKGLVAAATFATQFLIANPRAVHACRRYIDHDLNRCFLPDDLQADLQHPLRSGYEFERAREIVALLGGEHKIQRAFLIDLHTTTANMGSTIILTSLSSVNLWVAAYLVREIDGLRVITNELPREKSPFINSLSPYGFCIEVGPVAQGALDPKVLAATVRILQTVARALDCLVAAGFDLDRASATSGLDGFPSEVVAYCYERILDYPRNSQGDLLACVHPERYGRDFIPVEKGSPLFIDLDEKEYFQEFDGIFWPIFIGESAYMEKETAMVLTKRIVRSWKGKTHAESV